MLSSSPLGFLPVAPLAAARLPAASPDFASRLFTLEARFDPKAAGLTEPEWPEASTHLAQLLACFALLYAQLPARRALDEIGRLLAGARPQDRAELAVVEHARGELLDLL